jgi:hypothetical protein
MRHALLPTAYRCVLRLLTSALSASSAVSAASVISVLVCATPVQAQTSDLVGVRALGMGGAFTAVADDASATWWNPAGLASGSYFSAILEYAHPDDGPGDGLRGFSIAFPALGLSYYRLPRPPGSSDSTDTDTGSREDEGSLSVFGATVGQSLGNHLVIGSTVKVLNADGTKTGLDIGAMAAYRRARFGVMVRNVTEPDFGSGNDAFTLRRQARAGAAFTVTGRRLINAATLSVDADLLKLDTPLGEDRRIAVGGEVWTFRRNFAFRGGASRSTLGGRRTAFSGGASAAFRAGLFVDAYVTGAGTDESRDGWGLALRVTF